MSNYKPWGHSTCGFDGYQKVLHSGQKFLRLSYFHNLAVDSRSPFENETYTVYQVPSGKKFTMTGVLLICSGVSANTVNIHTGDSINAITTLRAKFCAVAAPSAGTSISIVRHNCNIEFAATKYITSTPIATVIYEAVFIGYEENE